MDDNIKIIKGNLFNSHAQTIVNTVNCVGVMGKGIALVYKLRYPYLFEKYQEVCRQHLLDIGKLWLYKAEDTNPWVLNFPTKKHWKYPSQYEYLELGLQKFLDTYKSKGIQSIAYPLLGANNGGLDGERVLEIMRKYLSKCEIPVEIYIYDPKAKDDLFDAFKLKWNSIPSNQLKQVTGIRMQKQLDIISDALASGNVSSLISLIEYPGIGLTTMQKCYRMVMESQVMGSPNLFQDLEETSQLPFDALTTDNQIEVKLAKKLYVIDTNAFIDCPNIMDKLRKPCDVIVSAKVLDELDYMKIKLDASQKKNADNALRRLSRLGPNDVCFELSDTALLPPDFDKRSPDNMILSVALKYKGKSPILVTSDNGLQLKCKSLGIAYRSLKDLLGDH